MIRIMLVLALGLFGCHMISLPSTSQQPPRVDVHETVINTFSSTECNNPCWQGIEVGVTNRETVIDVLEEQEIEYDIPGVIHLHSIPNDTVPGISPREIPPVNHNIYGDINIGQSDDDVVQSIDFYLDLCVSTVIEAYGAPSVRFAQDNIPTTLVYPDHQLLFFVDTSTLRIDGVILHMKENMPSADELEDWAEYADAFSENCTDVFTES